MDVFVMYGALRSGTTVFRLMLDAHPCITCRGETDFLFDHLVRSGDGELRYDREALAADRIYRETGVSWPEGLDGAAAAANMVQQLAAGASGSHVLVTHRHFDRILDIFPDARIIHVLRDPRDVAKSCVVMGWAGNVWRAVDIWCDTERSWDSASNRLVEGQAITLSYEALILEAEESLRRVCAFLRQDYDPVMLSYGERTTYAAPDTALVEQWRRKQTEREVALVEHRVGDLLRRRGYQPSGLQVIAPNTISCLVMYIQNKYCVWTVRIARYGWYDSIRYSLGRRLGLATMHRSAQARIDAKVINDLK